MMYKPIKLGECREYLQRIPTEESEDPLTIAEEILSELSDIIDGLKRMENKD